MFEMWNYIYPESDISFATRGCSRFVSHGERGAESTVQQRANVRVETVEKGIAMILPGIILARQ